MMATLGAILITLSLACGGAALLYLRRIQVAQRDRAYTHFSTGAEFAQTPRRSATRADTSLEARLLCAGIDASGGLFIAVLTALVVVSGSALALMSHHPLGFAAGALLSLGGAALFLKQRTTQRSHAFNRQLASALPMIAENMRGGATAESAFATVAHYIDNPLHAELTRVSNDVTTANMTLSVALGHLAKRMDDPDVELLATTIAIQKTGGGNLADILDSLAQTITKRLDMRGHLDAITSSARLSASIVGAMPPAILVLLSLTSPSYMADFWESPYWAPIIVVVAVLDVLGLVVIRHMHALKLD
ncbi:MAG: type II secretion system F family protein [Raoultibacter sp.]